MVANTSSAASQMAFTIVSCGMFPPSSCKSAFARGFQTGQDLFLDLLCCEGFTHITLRPELHGLEHLALASLGADHDHREALPVGMGPQIGEQLQAVHVRDRKSTRL